MNRFVMIFTVFAMMFAASGMHRSFAMESVQKATDQYQSLVADTDLVQTAVDEDCCREMAFEKHSPHDHCSMNCAILANATRAEQKWKIGKITEFRTDILAGNLFDLMKRPPKNLI